MPETKNDKPLPAVSMDIGLGKRLPKGAVLDFDFDRFNEIATDMGLSDEEIGKADIRIGRPEHERIAGWDPGALMYNGMNRLITAGGYNRATKKISVKYDRRPDRISSHIVHETQHYADDLSGKSGEERWEGIDINPPSRKRAKKLALGGIAALGASTVSPELSWLLAVSGASLLGSQVGKALPVKGNYLYDPKEVRAKEAEKKYKNPNRPLVNIRGNAHSDK